MIDLRGFPYMPIYIDRLQKSKAWLVCKREPALAFYMVNLWLRAWHEVPCGSLEDDDDVLADAAMCDPRTWGKVKDKVLRGWERNDGRLYHNVVTEVAEVSWRLKQGQRHRTEAARQAKSERRHSSVTDPPTDSVTDSVTEHVTDSVTEHVTASNGIEGNRREGNRKEGREGVARQARRAPAPKGKIPEDWFPDEEGRECAKRFGIGSVEQMTDAIGHFIDHYTARETLRGDWQAQWREWCRNEPEFRRNGK